jgi:uncharacterized protein (DUF427 family)
VPAKDVNNAPRQHYALTERSSDIYLLFLDEELLLESDQVVVLTEVCQHKNHPEVIYFPQLALAPLHLSESDKRSFCPIKGYASYWNYRDRNNCIWSYQDPLAGVIQIKNHFACDKGQGFRIIRMK